MKRALWALLALFLVGFAIFEGVKYGWVATAILIAFAVLPDIALIGAFSDERPRIRPESVKFYNLMHSPWIPLAIMLVALAPWPSLGWGLRGGLEIFLAGLAWLAHIAVDRAVGYGVRNADGTIRAIDAKGSPTWCQA